MAADDQEQIDKKQRQSDIFKLKRAQEKKKRNANKSILGDLDGPGSLVNLEKNYSPEADRGVVTNRTHTWMVELPTEHIGNEKDGPLCGRVRDGGNIYVKPPDATCKRCSNIYRRMKKKNKKMQPIRPNIQPKAEVQENLQRVMSAAIISLYLENVKSIKIRGTKSELFTIAEALKATRTLYTVLQNNNMISENIVTAIVKRNLAASAFQRMFGFSWPL